MSQITIEATCGPRRSARNQENKNVLSVDPNSEVILTVKSDPTAQVESFAWTRGDDSIELTSPVYDYKQDLPNGEATVTFKVTDETAGDYGVTAKFGADASDTANVQVNLPSPEDDVAPGVIEVRVGENDPWLTYGGGAVLALGLFVLGSVFVGFMGAVKLPDAGSTVPPDQVIDGTFAMRVTAMIQLATTFAGIALLLAGVYLGALEVRGRLKASARTKPAADDGSRGGDVAAASGELVEKFTALTKELVTARATVAVLVVGALVLAFSLWASANMATSVPSEANPSPAASSVSPTASSTP